MCLLLQHEDALRRCELPYKMHVNEINGSPNKLPPETVLIDKSVDKNNRNSRDPII